MRQERSPIAERRKEQRLLREHLASLMAEYGGVLDPDQRWQHEWTLDTKRVGRLTLSIHLSAETEGSDLFSIYVRTALGRTSEDIRATGELILATFHTGSRHFNGKLNIHSSTREGAEMELERYLHWMMS